MKTPKSIYLIIWAFLAVSCGKDAQPDVDPCTYTYRCVIRLTDQEGKDIITRNQNESVLKAVKAYSLDRSGKCVPGVRTATIYYNYYGIGLATMLSTINLTRDPECETETATVIDWSGKMIPAYMDTLIFRSYKNKSFDTGYPEGYPATINYEIYLNDKTLLQFTPEMHRIRITGVHPVPDFYLEMKAE